MLLTTEGYSQPLLLLTTVPQRLTQSARKSMSFDRDCDLATCMFPEVCHSWLAVHRASLLHLCARFRRQSPPSFWTIDTCRACTHSCTCIVILTATNTSHGFAEATQAAAPHATPADELRVSANYHAPPLIQPASVSERFRLGPSTTGESELREW